MLELNGHKIFYEVLPLPKGKWAIQIEITRMRDGVVIAHRHNPFPGEAFATKLEALDHANRHVRRQLAANEDDADGTRRA